MSNFLDNFYGTLFHPDRTFEGLKNDPPLFQGFLLVIFVSMLASFINFQPPGGIFDFAFFSAGLFFSVITGISSWLILAFFLEIIACIFKQQGHTKVFLTLSAFSLIPWLFLAPTQLFKVWDLPGTLLGIFLGFAIWVWVIILSIKAIMKAYDASFGRVLIILLTPLIGSSITTLWMIYFFSTLIRILSN